IGLFAASGNLTLAVVSMLSFALFLKIANGTTYAIVPCGNKKAVGVVSGVVGAGGNVGGMLMGFLFKSATITYSEAFLYIGVGVAVVGLGMLLVNFAKEPVQEEVLEEVQVA
ncbi:MAG: MFS transporter, partial [Sphingobacteriaceae bacterium]|nr:MFS transporter [Cytophagaceae bacterium]